MNETIRMQISAFVDGELPDNESELLLRRMSQDDDLRRLVAEYIEIGRTMRGEVSSPGAEHLRDRLAAELGDKPYEADIEVPVKGGRSGWRPLAGAAVAATVAVVAIVGLRQVSTGDIEPATMLADEVVDAAEDSGYTVPPAEDVLRQYVMSHGLEASEHGAVGINPRYVSLELSEEIAQDDDEANATDDDSPAN
ncbi:MAG: sigma-E factor negative regulatory protein [Gammaproteobacteria bacterium]|nr:sigma-E factor negative regulatory protein [Gammaproteobacteria bacterium]